MTGLLAVQKKLSLDILELEDSRVASQLQLLESMERRAKEFSFEDDGMEEMLAKANKKGRDKDPTSLQAKRSVLKAEEAKLNQMK